MTHEDIIRMAREAGFAINTRTGDINASHGSYNWIISRELERFAALVEAAEREQCALAAWEIVQYEVHADLADRVAQAIRARSQA